MRISFYILVISVGFIFADSLSLEIDASNAKTYEDSYEKAIDFRIDGDYNKSLSILLQIEAFHIKSTYVIAEIYLNEVKNPNIALDYYRQVVDRTSFWREAGKDLSLEYKNLYRKSLFMISYIYSNYLGMYSDAYNSFLYFMEIFPDDELIESVKYEIELLKPFEEDKNIIIGRDNG